MIDQLQYSYPEEFISIIKKIKNRNKNIDLCELDGIGEQLDAHSFSKRFFTKKVSTSDVSVDANANIEDTTVAQYISEISKPVLRMNAYYLLWKYSKELFGHEFAEKAINAQLMKDVYINDFHTFGINAYCFNFTCMDVIYMGLPYVKKCQSHPPKHLSSFIGQIIQFITYAGNHLAGASAISDVLIGVAYFVEKFKKENSNLPEEYIEKIIKQEIQSLIYSVNQPFRGGVQCVDEETEVLTPDGFKKYTELNQGDPVYSINSENGLEIEQIQKINSSSYDGEMHSYSGRDIDFLVTPNHRIKYYKNNSNLQNMKFSYDLIDAKTPLRIPIAADYYQKEDYNISDDLLIFLTIVLTDGSLGHQKNRSSRISIFKSENRFGIELIKELSKKLNLEFSSQIRTNGFGFKNSSKVHVFRYNVESSKEIVQLLNNTKKELPKWMFLLSRRQAKLVLDTWLQFDGHKHITSYNASKLQCDNLVIANQLQHLAVIAGYGGTIKTRIISNNKKATIHFILYQRTKKSVIKKEKKIYKGIVWCPTTNNGVVIFRKNGKVFISGNSFFFNISIYDNNFLEKITKEYIFPNEYHVKIETIKYVQNLYLDLMNETLQTSPVTFPITTACFAVDENKNILDSDFLNYIAEKNLKYSFINIFAGKTSITASCCRLRNDGSNSDFFNSIGGSSTKIGSLGVVTINIPRLAFKSENREEFLEYVQEYAEMAAKINRVKRYILKKRIDGGYYPLYSLGFMNLNKQYCTTGLIGINEACEVLGSPILENKGQQLALDLIDIVNKVNALQEKKYKYPANIEQVPGEALSVKLAEADRLLGYNKQYKIYSNQFIPLTSEANFLDRIKLQGVFDKHLTGGAILHLNMIDQITDVNFMKQLIETAINNGVVYHAVNYNLQKCEDNHLTVGKNEKCPVCGKPITDNFTRVVGFLVNTKNFNKTRREIDYPNRKWYNKESSKL